MFSSLKSMAQEEIKGDTTLYTLKITGLFGGHSGVDIDKGRINSNLLAAKYLEMLEDVQIVSFVGGNKDNAIANATEVVFITKDKDANKKMQEYFETIEVTDADKNLKMELEISTPNKDVNVITNKDSNSLIRLLIDLKQNVIAMSKDVEGLVETSGNVGIVKVENGEALICEALRSSIDEDKAKVMDYNKFKYENKKRAKENIKKQRASNLELKEYRLSVTIDIHDFDTRVKNSQKYLEKGHKVKASIRFKGREMAHTELGKDVLIRFAEALKDVSDIEQKPTLDGRNMTMILMPKKEK